MKRLFFYYFTLFRFETVLNLLPSSWLILNLFNFLLDLTDKLVILNTFLKEPIENCDCFHLFSQLRLDNNFVLRLIIISYTFLNFDVLGCFGIRREFTGLADVYVEEELGWLAHMGCSLDALTLYCRITRLETLQFKNIFLSYIGLF